MSESRTAGPARTSRRSSPSGAKASGGRPDLRRFLLVDHPDQCSTDLKTPLETLTTTRLEVGNIEIALEVNLHAGPEQKLALRLVHARSVENWGSARSEIRSPNSLRFEGRRGPWEFAAAVGTSVVSDRD
jgi:hypothetical protein